jgi:hypothetical protein
MYRKIADLNSVTPTFQLEPEAPSIVPIAPHFGNNSTNIDYTLHIQPNWGFRVKEELDPDLSDSKVVYKTVELNEETGLEEEVPKDYNGAIYYNKAGFSREFISHSDEANEFSILPTGISGKKYVKHENPRFNDVEYEERPDIQEITVKLPEIGNIMSNVWDLMYGGYELNNSTERNLNIEWDNTIGLRMFETDPTGNGFSFNESKGATVAGCINSVHDLMGMIISEPMEDTSTAEDIQKALDAATTGKIYFGALTPNSDKRGYYFKDKAFKFTSFEDKKKEDPDFNEATYRGGRKYYVLNQFEPKQYFTYSDKNFYLESADLPTEDTLYYKLGNPVPVKVKQWQPIIEVTNPETGAVEK